MKQLDKGHIWGGATNWTGEEANEEESMSSHEKKFEENESIVEKILPHQDQTFIKAQKKAAAGVPDVDRGTVNLKNFLDCLI
ncbi:hypothetical protein T03_16457 [Trichinella britovi]|uniref:Uncharacterized protein n=1 Tax=Trichinella britovi TaxID=45882 RepID=A0A0V1CKI5_TRIBR|nr:hypothetical protein T03_16457 [Trichinella britovi]